MKTFMLTEEHIKLLKRAYVDWWDCEFGAPIINPKRPYGNSDVIGDIGEILGIKPDNGEDFTDEQEEGMNQIHKETQTALQIILSTGSFTPGLYEMVEYKRWRMKDVIYDY